MEILISFMNKYRVIVDKNAENAVQLQNFYDDLMEELEFDIEAKIIEMIVNLSLYGQIEPV